MHNEATDRLLAALVSKGVPARMNATETARFLGFPEHDIQILMRTRRLIPLGNPAPNAPKFFAAIEVVQLAADRDWLHAATKDVARYWRAKRERLAAAGEVSFSS